MTVPTKVYEWVRSGIMEIHAESKNNPSFGITHKKVKDQKHGRGGKGLLYMTRLFHIVMEHKQYNSEKSNYETLFTEYGLNDRLIELILYKIKKEMILNDL